MKKGFVSKLSFLMAFVMILGLFYEKEVEAKPRYDKIYSFSEGMARVRIGDEETGKYGYINDKGEMVVKPIYEKTLDFQDGRAWVEQGNKIYFINKKGKKVAEVGDSKKMDFYSYLGKGLYLFYDNEGKAGLVRHDGKFLIKPKKYEAIDEYYEGRAIVRTPDPDNKCGVIDEKGREILKPKYDALDIYQDGICRFSYLKDISKNHSYRVAVEKQGYIDKQGKEIPGLKYDRMNSFREGLAAFCIREKEGKERWGFVDKKGKVIIKPIYDGASRFSEGLARVKKGEQVIYINKKGEEVLKPEFEIIYDGRDSNTYAFSPSFVRPGVYDEWTKENRFNYEGQGDSVDFVGDFHEGLAIIVKEEDYRHKYGVMNKKGKIILEPKYDFISDFYDGRAMIKVDDEGDESGIIFYGMIDKTGKEIVKPIYEEALKFEALTGFRTNNWTYGLVDKSGKFIVKPEYSNFNFSQPNGYPAFVQKNGKWGKLNPKDEKKTKFIYDDFSSFNGSKVAPVRKGDAWYLIDKNGKELYQVK